MGASLFDAHPPPGSGDPKLDECCLSRLQCDALIRQMETRLETEKFLVQVEGPWIASTASVALAKPNALVSQGMKKVITRKFQKPGKYVPKHPMQEQQNQPPGMRKRQRQPLQPGELQRRYYGDAMSQQSGPPPSVPSAWNQGMQQGPPPQNPVAPRFNNRSPQPPFEQQGQQAQQPFQQAKPNMASNGYGNAMVRQHQYNTQAHATGSHQTASHQHAVHPSQHPPVPVQGTNSFVGNKFNINQFYGEDEECSQEEEEGEDDGWNLQLAPPRNANPQQSTGAPYQTRDSAAKPCAPNSFCYQSLAQEADNDTMPSMHTTARAGSHRLEVRQVVAWFLIGVVAAVFLQWLQVHAVGGSWTGLVNTGETSQLRARSSRRNSVQVRRSNKQDTMGSSP